MTADLLVQELSRLQACRVHGQVTSVMGLLVEVGGVERRLAVGSLVNVYTNDGRRVPCEVVGFREGRALCMPFGPISGIGLGCRAQVSEEGANIFPSQAWLGRVVNALGQPIDSGGVLPSGGEPVPIRRQPPPAHQRNRVGAKLDVGVRAINTFLTTCRGQRMGIFAGSGVGKSSIMSMMARYTEADVCVIGLVGERGREVQEFIEEDLGPEGMKRTVLVVATSDESPLMRRQAAHTTLAVAEYFRDQGNQVLCLMDSVTRFAMAQREIGLSAGEPPTTKGYPPTVFAELPRLLERAGPGTGRGAITGLFTVLVEGDDHNEPIADATRGILDGHIVLTRQIAERGRYPAIDILRSISRTLPGCNTDEQNRLIRRARELLSTYNDMAELIRLGAYRHGSDPKVDEAIHYNDALEDFLSQGRYERASLADGYKQLAEVLGEPEPAS